MTPFSAMGATLAAVLGRNVTLTLTTGDEVSLRAIWQPAFVETRVGEYGVQVQDEYPVLDVPRSTWIATGRPASALHGATLTVDLVSYTIHDPRDDGLSLIRCRAFLSDA